MKNTFFSILLLSITTAVVVLSCQPSGNSPGRTFLPDMTYSNAYETYSSTKFQYQTEDDSISALLPVNGTIPRGYFPKDENIRNNEALMMAHLFKNYFQNPAGNSSVDDNAQRELAKSMLKNPYKNSPDVMNQGKKIYDIYCAVCHGNEGEGNGSIVELADGSEGPYTSRPPSFSNRLAGMSDGEIYYSITYGKNMMGGYFTQVSAEDRWKVLNYVKMLGGIEGETIAQINVDEIKVESGSEFNIPDISFNVGSADLKYDSKLVLDQLVSFFNNITNVRVEIGSHADSRGNSQDNLVLSNRRADSVVNYLVSKGVNPSQLIANGYGDTKPSVNCGNNCSEEDHKNNRRTTFKVL